MLLNFHITILNTTRGSSVKTGWKFTSLSLDQRLMKDSHGTVNIQDCQHISKTPYCTVCQHSSKLDLLPYSIKSLVWLNCRFPANCQRSECVSLSTEFLRFAFFDASKEPKDCFSHFVSPTEPVSFLLVYICHAHWMSPLVCYRTWATRLASCHKQTQHNSRVYCRWSYQQTSSH